MLLGLAVALLPTAPALADDTTREPVVAAFEGTGPGRARMASPFSGLSPASPGTAARAARAEQDSFTAAMATSLTEAATTNPYLGAALSGTVVDPDGTVVWRHNDTRARVPASALKLVTAYTVLESIPPQTTLVTTTCQSRQTPSAVFVRGGGDPSLTWARLQVLAAQTAAPLKRARRTQITLHLDGSIFPAPTAAPGWSARYLRSDVQHVRGLTVAGFRGADGRLAVGKVLVAALKKQGITATVAGTAVTPRRCTGLASTGSAPVARLVADMLATSNNDYAEFLLRHAALRRGFAASWRGGLDNERDLLSRAGVRTGDLRIFDGSGLSRANRVPVAPLADVLRLLRDEHSEVVFAWGALPLAGQTGTLADRFSAPGQACARGQVQAKTGTLMDAVALAGVARGVDGRDRVFVFLENGLRKNAGVRSAFDTLAATVVGCGLV